MKYAGRGGNTSPDFQFKWIQGTADGMPPATLASYAVIFHDMENSTRGGTVDTLHWSIFDIPATAKGIPEGLMAGDQADGSRQGPGIRGGAYFGPGAGPGAYHHYVFEFYALDIKLDLPANTTREALLAKMEGHVVGKAVYVGRFRQEP
jgi:Raf kinase inhibitor-like YbhB/YbcL family protein